MEFKGRLLGEVDVERLGRRSSTGVGGVSGSAGGVVGSSSGTFGLTEFDGRWWRGGGACGVNTRGGICGSFVPPEYTGIGDGPVPAEF